jgi:hypothetical protein
LLTFAVFMQRSLPSVTPTLEYSPMAAVALSNQSAAAWLPGSFAHEQNRLPSGSFERTNGRPASRVTFPSRWRETN